VTGRIRIDGSNGIAWPRETRELHGPLLDSSVWNEFRFRPDDVVIATCAKAGTTWTQQIVPQPGAGEAFPDPLARYRHRTGHDLTAAVIGRLARP
jgi:hypothetical protein